MVLLYAFKEKKKYNFDEKKYRKCRILMKVSNQTNETTVPGRRHFDHKDNAFKLFPMMPSKALYSWFEVNRKHFLYLLGSADV